jgi:hypothetical protein
LRGDDPGDPRSAQQSDVTVHSLPTLVTASDAEAPLRRARQDVGGAGQDRTRRRVSRAPRPCGICA